MPRPTSHDSQQRPLVVDSSSARREFTQCQYCYKNKDQHKIKLSLCTGCHVATYCSTKCQRAHWPSHKTVCMHRREQQQHFAELDREVVQAAPSSDGSDGSCLRILPSELYAELRAFTKKFNPVLFQAGFNCLQLDQHPEYALDLVLFVMLDRLPDVAPDSRPWSRFKVRFCGPMPVQYIVEQLASGEKGETFLRMKRDQERQHIESGNTGTLTALIAAVCPGVSMLYNVSSMGFGDHSKHALVLEENWQETFINTVKRLCGRLPQKEEGQEATPSSLA